MTDPLPWQTRMDMASHWLAALTSELMCQLQTSAVGPVVVENVTFSHSHAHAHMDAPSPPCTQVVDMGQRGFKGYSPSSFIAVVAHALSCATYPIKEAQKLLRQSGDMTFEVNGHLFAATVLLLSVLDGIASACQKIAPLPNQGDIFFRSYPFACSELLWIRSYQQQLLNMHYNGISFFDHANKVKHELAFIGVPKYSFRRAIADVYDKSDQGYVHDLLMPIFEIAKAIICHLSCLYGVRDVPEYPSFTQPAA